GSGSYGPYRRGQARARSRTDRRGRSSTGPIVQWATVVFERDNAQYRDAEPGALETSRWGSLRASRPCLPLVGSAEGWRYYGDAWHSATVAGTTGLGCPSVAFQA